MIWRNKFKILTLLLIIGGGVWYYFDNPIERFFPSNQRDQELTDAAVVIDGEVITVGEYNKKIETFYSFNPLYSDADETTRLLLNGSILENIINEKLILNRANELGIVLTQSEIDEFYRQSIVPFGENESDVFLKDFNMTLVDWIEMSKLNLIIKKVVDKDLVESIQVSPEELTTYLEKNPIDFTNPKYDVSQILVGNRELAALIYRDLAAGASFEDYVEKYSLSSDKIDGGSLGVISKGQLPEQLDKAIFELKKEGVISDVVESPLGFHVFLVNKIYGKDDVKIFEEKIRLKLLQEKISSAYQDWLKKLRNTANIEVKITSL